MRGKRTVILLPAPGRTEPRYTGRHRHFADLILQQLHGNPDEDLQAVALALADIVKQSGFRFSQIERMLARGKSLADVFGAVAVRLRRQNARKPGTDSGQLRRALTSLE